MRERASRESTAVGSSNQIGCSRSTARATTAASPGSNAPAAIEHHFRLVAGSFLEVVQAPADRVDVSLQPRHALPRRHGESESAISLGLCGSRLSRIVEPRHDPGLESHRTAQILE